MLRSKILKLKLNNDGMTLVEMMVSFVLLSIFVVSATALIGSITNIYYDVEGSTNGLEVSNIIYNKIRGEMETAILFYENQPVNEGGFTPLKFQKADGSVVSLGCEKSGSEGRYYFVERYDAVSSTKPEEQYKEVGWRFSESTYMGYSVTALTISQAGSDYDNNIYKVELTVSSPQFGDYSTERYVKCYRINP